MGEKSVVRISRNEYFMLIAQIVALRSTCLRAHVGAVCVRDHRVLSTGYNGAPRGFPHCTPLTCNAEIDHCRATVHAELNALLNAAYHGVSVKGSTLYCTLQPCEDCARALINAGIVEVYYGESTDSKSLELFDYAKIPVHFLPEGSYAVWRVSYT